MCVLDGWSWGTGVESWVGFVCLLRCRPAGGGGMVADGLSSVSGWCGCWRMNDVRERGCGEDC